MRGGCSFQEDVFELALGSEVGEGDGFLREGEVVFDFDLTSGAGQLGEA